jgi:hypothetical protein
MICKIKLCAAKQRPSETEGMLLEETLHFQVLQPVFDIRFREQLNMVQRKTNYFIEI